MHRALVLSLAVVAVVGPILTVGGKRLRVGLNGPVLRWDPPPPTDILAPLDGGGMTHECDDTNNPTTSNGIAIIYARAGPVWCVSGSGQTVTQIPADIIRQKKESSTSTVLGLEISDAVANRIGLTGGSRDWSPTSPEVITTNVTCARTAVGMKGNDVNGATTCTAVAGDGGTEHTAIVTVAKANFAGTIGSCASWYAKNRTGAGTLDVRQYDGGYYPIQLATDGGGWRRVAQAVNVNYDTAIHVPGMCGLANLDGVAGFRLPAGAAIDLDFTSVETNDVIDHAEGRFVSLSPVELVDANPRATHHDNLALSIPIITFKNDQGCVGYTVTWGSPETRYACPQMCTDSTDAGFFAYYDTGGSHPPECPSPTCYAPDGGFSPNFDIFDGTNNEISTVDGVLPGVSVSTEAGWSGGNGGTMFGDNSNGASLSGPYNGAMIGGGTQFVLGSQYLIPGNICYLNGVMSNIILGPSRNSCHW